MMIIIAKQANIIGKNIRSLSPTRSGKFPITVIPILEFLADESTVTAKIDSIGSRRRTASMKEETRNDVITAVSKPVTDKIIKGENFVRSPFAVA